MTFKSTNEQFGSRTTKILAALSVTGALLFSLGLINPVRESLFAFIVKTLQYHRYALLEELLVKSAFFGTVGCLLFLVPLSERLSKTINNAYLFVDKRCSKIRGLFLLLPILWGFIIVSLLGANAPYADDWDVIRFLDSVQTHGLHFTDLVRNHFEHRIFFPRLLFYFGGLLTHVNIKFYMCISWLLNSMIYITLIAYTNHANKKITSQKTKPILFDLILGFCCFNLVQHENIFWGFSIGFFMVASFSIVCLYFFNKWVETDKWLYFIISGIAALIASFSWSAGLFLFPVLLFCLLLLLFSREKKIKALLTFLWK